MKITIDVDKDKYIERFEYYWRKFVTVAYQWLTTDGEALGYILGCLHFMTSILIFLFIIISHTIYPAFWLQCTVFVCLLLIWIQHVVLQVCVVVVAERKLTNNTSPFFELLKDIFKVEPIEFATYFVLVETVAIGCFGLEIISHLSNRFIHSHN